MIYEYHLEQTILGYQYKFKNSVASLNWNFFVLCWV